MTRRMDEKKQKIEVINIIFPVNLFVDYPPIIVADTKTCEQAPENSIESEVVKVGDQYLELVAEPKNANNAIELDFSGNEPVPRKFSAKVSDVLLDPSSVCVLSWADQQRLFMCKVRAEADGIPFSPKAFRRLENEISSSYPLRDYVDQMEGSNFNVACRHCERVLHNHSVRYEVL
uniref:Uncharacterized protein n=1 Tax=Ditylenchus dipsaci TaxID=166011 RepID=A0A915D0L2_9BILA